MQTHCSYPGLQCLSHTSWRAGVVRTHLTVDLPDSIYQGFSAQGKQSQTKPHQRIWAFVGLCSFPPLCHVEPSLIQWRQGDKPEKGRIFQSKTLSLGRQTTTPQQNPNHVHIICRPAWDHPGPWSEWEGDTFPISHLPCNLDLKVESSFHHVVRPGCLDLLASSQLILQISDRTHRFLHNQLYILYFSGFLLPLMRTRDSFCAKQSRLMICLAGMSV